MTARAWVTLVVVLAVSAACTGSSHRAAQTKPPEESPPQLAKPVATAAAADATFTLLRDQSCTYLQIRHLAISTVDRMCDAGEIATGASQPCLWYAPFSCRGDCPAPPCALKLNEVAAWAILAPSSGYACILSAEGAARVLARPPTGALLTLLGAGSTGATVLAMTTDGHPWGGGQYVGPPRATDLAACTQAGPWKQPVPAWRPANVVITHQPGIPGIVLLGTTEGFRYATAINASVEQPTPAYFEFAPSTSTLEVYLLDNPAQPRLVRTFPLPARIHQPSCAHPGFVLHIEPSFSRADPTSVTFAFVGC